MFKAFVAFKISSIFLFAVFVDFPLWNTLTGGSRYLFPLMMLLLASFFHSLLFLVFKWILASKNGFAISHFILYSFHHLGKENFIFTFIMDEFFVQIFDGLQFLMRSHRFAARACFHSIFQNFIKWSTFLSTAYRDTHQTFSFPLVFFMSWKHIGIIIESNVVNFSISQRFQQW